jgi:hypothetical protein
MQVILVTRTLEDRWPLGDIAFGVFFFTIGQVILYAFSTQICLAVQHYLDGLFFATTCNLLAVMMIYKVGHHIDFSPDNSILTFSSTGIQLLKKTSNSPLEQSRTTGK